MEVERPMCQQIGLGGVFLKSLFLFAKYGFSMDWQGAGWGDHRSPPLPDQDPFQPGAPEPFPGVCGFFNFSLPPAVAVERARCPDRPLPARTCARRPPPVAPMPCQRHCRLRRARQCPRRDGRRQWYLVEVERPMCQKIGLGGVFLKSLFFLPNTVFLWTGRARGGATIGRPPSLIRTLSNLGPPNLFLAFVVFSIFPSPPAVAVEQFTLRRILPRWALARRGVDQAISLSPPRWSGAAPSRKRGEDLPPTCTLFMSVGGCCHSLRRITEVRQHLGPLPYSPQRARG